MQACKLSCPRTSAPRAGDTCAMAYRPRARAGSPRRAAGSGGRASIERHMVCMQGRAVISILLLVDRFAKHGLRRVLTERFHRLLAISDLARLCSLRSRRLLRHDLVTDWRCRHATAARRQATATALCNTARRARSGTVATPRLVAVIRCGVVAHRRIRRQKPRITDCCRRSQGERLRRRRCGRGPSRSWHRLWLCCSRRNPPARRRHGRSRRWHRALLPCWRRRLCRCRRL